MTIEQFGKRYRLRIQRDHCGDLIIQGRLGDIYQYSRAELGLCFQPAGEPRPKKWANTRRACLAMGMVRRQNGDAEGCLTFNPGDPDQAKLAIKAVGARPKRRLTPEQVRRQVATLAKFRSRPKEEARLAPWNASGVAG